ncbi:GNAT family protein [Soonwooa sp.]|uniref:GNAT family N-acetyltransferase n=1 Tax=Soonwooa sp. TaxID=1938592 RepID=UPI002624592E|nr:GNAT family protein [Soonwooa sp.]
MQKIEPQDFVLKNGKLVTIRQAAPADAEQLLDCIKIYVDDSPFIPQYADEITNDVNAERDLINTFAENDNSLLLVAEHGSKIIGNIDLTGSQRRIMAHTGMIGMGMVIEWQNTGLGTVLLKEMMAWAKQNPILEVVWLQVYTENLAGLSLYKKIGFRENGIVKNFFKQDGRYYDVLTMSISVK